MFKSIKIIVLSLLVCFQLNGCNNNIVEPNSTESTESIDSYTLKNIDSLGIYYGWLSSFNSSDNSWDQNNIAADIGQYDLFVIGGGIEETTHDDHSNSVSIITKVHNSYSTMILGYISIGNTSSLSIPVLKANIDKIADNLNADGVFIDEFGFDYWSDNEEMRTRQNTIVSYIKNKGMKVMVNAWDPDDVFISESNNPTVLGDGDYYLVESYVMTSATKQTFDDYRTRMEKITAASETNGVEFYGISTTAEASSEFDQDLYDYLYLSAQVDSLSGVGWGTLNYSASGTDNGVMPYRSVSSDYSEVYYLTSDDITVESDNEIISYSIESGTLSLTYSDYSIDVFL